MESKKISQIKKVHLIGIGGIGISALAKFFLAHGAQVSGSDVSPSFITYDLERMGAKIFDKQAPSNVPADAELVVYSDAIQHHNPERLAAAKYEIPRLSYFEALGEVSLEYPKTIAVSGNKGKTTTTAMLAHILEAAKLDPTAVVGSYVNDWKSNFRAGQSEFFIVEGDEWREHMSLLHPWAIVLTNIEADHLDYYGTFENEIIAFQKYVSKLPQKGLYFFNADDPVSVRLKRPKARPVSFGIKNKADLMASERKIEKGFQSFILEYKGTKLGRFILKQPGEFNVYNSLAAAAVSLEAGVSADIIRNALASFTGTWRRFQVTGEYNGGTIISDYAHHPTAVKAVIQAAKEFYPGHRLLVAFQPHHHHRTISLFNDFVQSFDGADWLLLSEIYKVTGREEGKDNISCVKLLEAVKERDAKTGVKRGLVFTPDLDDATRVLKKEIKKGDVVLILGAGDIYKICDQLK